jgi:hypothetical protein
LRGPRSDDYDPRFALACALALIAVIIAVDLWLVDQIAMQRTVGVLMATELVAFAMLCYVYYRQDYSELSRLWLFIGSGAMAAFIVLALFVGK